MIQNVYWMSPSTKKKATLKLENMSCNISGPDWTTVPYRDLVLKEKDGCLLENIHRIRKYHFLENMNMINKSVNQKKNWYGIPSHEVNAFYHPILNQIYIPEAILQAPMFHMTTKLRNYAYIGTVLGHEMIHAFDDHGCLFDHNGNLQDKSWWKPKDMKRYNIEKRN